MCGVFADRFAGDSKPIGQPLRSGIKEEDPGSQTEPWGTRNRPTVMGAEAHLISKDWAQGYPQVVDGARPSFQNHRIGRI